MYQYRDSGLDNVWLVNGYQIKKTAYGESVSIEDLVGLHLAICERLVEQKSPLEPSEFRFLRKELELSQKRLAEMFGFKEQTVANWEKGKTSIPSTADTLIRAIYSEQHNGNAHVQRIIQSLNEADLDEYNNKIQLSYSVDSRHWEDAA